MKTAFKKRGQRTGLSILRAVLISSLFFISGNTYGQGSGWTWGKSIGASGRPYLKSNAVSTFNGGSLYTLGSFSGEIDLDPGPDSVIVNSTSGNDLFITKQDANGEFIWGRKIGGNDIIYGNIVAVSEVRGENIYVAGSFQGTIDFDPGPSESIITSAGSKDIFILKLDSLGNFQWVKTFGSIGSDEAFSLAIDVLDGFVYTTGSYEGTVDFDPGALSYSLASQGSSDIFISKLDENGSFVWAKSIGSYDYDYGSSIITDPATGDVYTVGKFWDSADFDPGPGTFVMTSLFSSFILKLNSSGVFIWAKQIEYSSPSYGRSIAIDPDPGGSVYLTGTFQGGVDFDPGANQYMLTSLGASDIFILKLTTQGNFVWAKQIGGNNWEWCSSLALANQNNGGIYLTGNFMGSCDFDPGSGVYLLNSVFEGDVFISRLTTEGQLIWAESIGGDIWEGATSIAIDANSEHGPYVIGSCGSEIDVDPGPGIYNLEDGYVFNLSLDTTGGFEWAHNWITDQGGVAVGKEITMDPYSGKSVSVGVFYGKVDFDPGSGTQTLFAQGTQDVFINCLNSQGNWLWTKTISSTDGFIFLKAIRLDPFDQSIYLLGQFYGVIDFDPGTGIESYSAPTNDYGGSVFLLKLTANGEFMWVRTILGDENGPNCWSNDLAVDKMGHIYITGDFSYGPLDFDPGPSEFFLTTLEYSGYILKLDTLGNFKWVKKIGLEAPGLGCNTSANSIAVFPKNEGIYVTGIFAGDCVLGQPGDIFSTFPEWDNDIYIAKLDSSGQSEWVKVIGDPYTSDEVVAICTDRNSEKNVYLLGTYDGQPDFDPGPGTHIIYTYNGAYDIFLLKLDSLGSFVWVDDFGGLNSDGASDMTVDTLGNLIYLTGFFLDSMDADPSFEQENLVSQGYEDIFFISVKHTGELHHAEAIGTPWQDWFAGLSRNSGARVLMTGTFDHPTLLLDSIIIENAGAPGSEDVFVAMYEGCPGVVINTFDNGFGSLRRTIACSSPGDTIVFGLTLPNEITLTSGEISIQKNITISGPGVDQLSISGNNTSRIFNLQEGNTFGLQNITLKQAGSPSLGGALLIRGNTILENVTLKQNHEGGLSKALSILPPGELNILGNVQIKF